MALCKRLFDEGTGNTPFTVCGSINSFKLILLCRKVTPIFSFAEAMRFQKPAYICRLL